MSVISSDTSCKDGNWQCPIYNGTHETVIWSKMWKIRFFTLKALILMISPLLFISQKSASHFRKWKWIVSWNINIDIKFILDQDKVFKGTVVIRTMPSLHEVSLEITITVLLKLNTRLQRLSLKPDVVDLWFYHLLILLCLNSLSL